ncbi:MAG: Uma2 family endonuclease [Candidatus Poribacteria bacterium]|nr:Uma2 family endonuclease [Candidatus Poribacteria bacterium]MDE0015318.1 Uma2 family endonuclease [Candidatus Poribacteria bacterium]
MNAQEFGALPADGNPDALLSPEGLPLRPIKMTLEEFLESDLEGYEYIKGELIPMPPTSVEHGYISVNLSSLLHLYVRENQLGRVLISDTGFRIGEHVLMPDIAFLTSARIPDDLSKASPIPPDLAVEVVSPTDVLYKVEEKVFAYLEAGTQLVWVLKPRSKTVTVYRSETDITLLTRNDTLTGENVIEGFSCQVAELFE